MIVYTSDVYIGIVIFCNAFALFCVFLIFPARRYAAFSTIDNFTVRSFTLREELVNRTVKAAEREERRRKIIGLWKYTAIAACFCFVCLGIWGAAFKDKIVIQDVTFASSEMEIGLNLGKKDISETREWEDIQVEKYTEKDDENIPKELWKLKPGRVHGEKVYIGKTEDGILHAVFEKDGKIWYVTEEKGDKENLTEYLKKTL